MRAILVSRKHQVRLTLSADGYASDNVNVADGNLLNKVSVLQEDLHARAFVAAVTHDVLACLTLHSHLTRVPQLPFLLACDAKLVLVFSVLVKDLNAVIHRVCDNNVIVHSQAEAVR